MEWNGWEKANSDNNNKEKIAPIEPRAEVVAAAAAATAAAEKSQKMPWV